MSSILSERAGLQRVEVDGRPAYVLTQLIGTVGVGDRVVVNTTAVELGLGTGGWDVVHWNLARDSLRQPGPGGVMKLRYTSLQVDTGAAEDGMGVDGPVSLDGVAVVVCGLHSQLACVAAVLADTVPGTRVVYVMTDSAALPLALSELVADLSGRGLLAATVTCGQAFGGDFEAVNVHSALHVARAVARAEVVVVAPGPGVVGTDSTLGFGALEVATVIDAASDLGGRPVVALRCSDADPRPRHRGISHHTRTSLALAHGAAAVALPRGGATSGLPAGTAVVEVDVPDVADLLRRHRLAVTTMGRGPEEDAAFFRCAAAAGVVAAQLLRAG